MEDIHRSSEEVAETSPLLAENRPKSTSQVSVEQITKTDRPWLIHHLSTLKAHFKRWSIVYICGLFVLFVDFGSYFNSPSRLRMIEGATCRRFYRLENALLIDAQGEVPEKFCKLDPIQEELAFINGWKGSIDAFICMIFAIPWGVLADKKGRRFVAFISVTGILLNELWYIVVCYCYNTLPPRALFAGGIFLIIGGGPTVVLGVIMGIVADCSSPEFRAVVLYYIQATVLLSLVFGQPLGGIALKRLGYWIPSITGYCLMFASCIILCWMPTVSKTNNHHVTGGEEEAMEITGDQVSHSESGRNTSQKLRSQILSGLHSIHEVIMLVATNNTLFLGLATFLMTKAGSSIIEFLPQFASKRFGWEISDASYIAAVQAAVSILMMAVILPTITKMLKTKYRISGPPLDLKIIRGSAPFLTIGCFLLGWASTPSLFITAIVIYTMGAGFRVTLESFLASTVRSDQLATLYVAISVIDTMGTFVASPLLAATFAKGLHMGGPWIGLPFIATSIIYLFCGVLTAFLSLNSPVQAE